MLVVLASVLFCVFLLSGQARAAASCPGSSDEASPGTICEDGSSPNPDPTLPAGCPGSAVLGPPAPGTVCSARPGRSTCTFSGGVCQGSTLDNPDCTDEDINQSNCKIVDYIVTFTRALSGIVGIVIVIMITVGGVQFSTSRDNPQALAAARGRIINALLALVFYMFSFALLQWLVPGGIL